MLPFLKARVHQPLSRSRTHSHGERKGNGMYIKKTSGPRAVALPGGGTMTRADLPAAGTQRWVASRKAAVVRAVAAGLLSTEEAMAIYDLSEEELESWTQAVSMHGEAALRATRLQKYRQP